MMRIMIGVSLRCFCRGLFKKLDILPIPCEYIFIIDDVYC